MNSHSARLMLTVIFLVLSLTLQIYHQTQAEEESWVPTDTNQYKNYFSKSLQNNTSFKDLLEYDGEQESSSSEEKNHLSKIVLSKDSRAGNTSGNTISPENEDNSSSTISTLTVPSSLVTTAIEWSSPPITATKTSSSTTTTPTPTTTSSSTTITTPTTTSSSSTTTTSTTPTRPTRPTSTTSTTSTTTVSIPTGTSSQRMNTSTATEKPNTPAPPVITCPEIQVGDYTFLQSPAGSWATPEKIICLKDDYTPVRLYCMNNGTWNLTEISCSSVEIKETTQDLYNLINEPSNTSLNKTNTIIQKNKDNLEAVDIHFISTILNKASNDDNITQSFVETVNNVMGVERNVLAKSQKLLNSTDTILYSLDQLLLNGGNVNLTVPKLLVFTVNPNDTVYGAMIVSRGDKTDFNSFEIKYLLEDNYEAELNQTNFEIAFIVPPKASQSDHYFITLFYDDHLFNQEKNSKSVGSWIISILLPDGFKPPSSNIKIYFKEFQTDFNQTCKHWKYGIENNIAITGQWSSDGEATKLKDGYYVCEVNHTTHFGMLVSDTLPENFVLDLITIFGSILSIIGIGIIFLTALVFKQWRNKANSKIILNVSLCLLLLIILFIISDKVAKGPFCTVCGILLQYMVIAQTCWASTVSYSSYRRFRMVSNTHIKHVVVKFCAFSWGIPLIVVIITAAVDIQTYDKTNANSNEICYPKGIYLKLGVCLPMAVILTVNLIIYILIVKTLSMTTLDIRKHETKRSFAVQKSILLLFFMMGITWIFGILTAFTDNVVFLYLFCTTATCHGFVIFAFYILDSSEIKQFWKNKLRYIVDKRAKHEQKSKDRQTTENSTEYVSG